MENRSIVHLRINGKRRVFIRCEGKESCKNELSFNLGLILLMF